MTKMVYEIYYKNEKNKDVVMGKLNRGELTKKELDEICSWNGQVYGLNLDWREKK